MSKIIVHNKSSLDDVIAMKSVTSVIREGKVSNFGKQYCYATSFVGERGEQYLVVCSVNKSGSSRFTVTDYPG